MAETYVYDGTVKRYDAGSSNTPIWNDILTFSPQTIDRFEEVRRSVAASGEADIDFADNVAPGTSLISLLVVQTSAPAKVTIFDMAEMVVDGLVSIVSRTGVVLSTASTIVKVVNEDTTNAIDVRVAVGVLTEPAT